MAACCALYTSGRLVAASWASMAHRTSAEDRESYLTLYNVEQCPYVLFLAWSFSCTTQRLMDIAAHSGLFRRCLMGRYCNIDCYRDQPRRWQAANVPLERMPAFTASKTLLCVASVLWAA